MIGVPVAYLFILWGTDIVKSLWLAGGFLRLLPLAACSLVVSIICLAFIMDTANDAFGVFGFIFVIMVIVQAITASVWTGNVGILFINLIGRAVLNIISTILGLIFPILFLLLKNPILEMLSRIMKHKARRA